MYDYIYIWLYIYILLYIYPLMNWWPFPNMGKQSNSWQRHIWFIWFDIYNWWCRKDQEGYEKKTVPTSNQHSFCYETLCLNRNFRPLESLEPIGPRKCASFCCCLNHVGELWVRNGDVGQQKHDCWFKASRGEFHWNPPLFLRSTMWWNHCAEAWAAVQVWQLLGF